MKLVIGGAFQGKLAYAKETYHIENWIDGRSCGFEEIWACGGIHHFHEYIRRAVAVGQEDGFHGWIHAGSLIDLEEQAEAFAEELYRRNPGILVVSNELGYGVVPMDKFDRDYRETVGRACTCIAARSDEVVRVVCGIGLRIKG